MNSSVWSTQDPREVIGKRASIVVVTGTQVMFAEVETKHAYCVFLEPSDPDFRRFVAEDEPWPDWFWTTTPQRKA